MEERRLRIFEKRVLRRIFGSKKNEVTGYWRKTLSEELHVLHSSPNFNLTGGACSTLRGEGRYIQSLAGKYN